MGKGDLINDVGAAKTLMRYGDHDSFSKYSSIYAFTTENINGYFKEFDFRNKKVLTVASSGDHMFNAILSGAREVDVFDINRYTKYYIELKKVAIEFMEYKDFIAFFSRSVDDTSTFNKEIYDTISSKLSAETRFFWDALYDDFPGYRIRRSLFAQGILPIELLCNFNPYINEFLYCELQEIINNFEINFIESNVTGLAKKIKHSKYDLILLSNISDYLNYIYYDNHLQKYKDLILNLSNYLNEGGSIVLAYIYNAFGYDDICIAFNNTKERDRVFTEPCFSVVGFEGIVDKDNQDAVMIYTKRS